LSDTPRLAASFATRDFGSGADLSVLFANFTISRDVVDSACVGVTAVVAISKTTAATKIAGRDTRHSDRLGDVNFACASSFTNIVSSRRQPFSASPYLPDCSRSNSCT